MKICSKYIGLFVCLLMGHVSGIKAQGIIITIAGNGITQYIGDGSPATNFSLALPTGIYADNNGKIYIADKADGRIRTVYHDTLSTIADTLGSPGDSGDGGHADTAKLRNPDGVCADTGGNMYITEWYDDLIRRVDAHTHIISTICGITGGGFGGDGGPAISALLSSPAGACTDIAGNIYIPDYDNQRIRKITIATGDINTIAGTGVNGYGGDNGPATSAELSYPSGIYVDTPGNVYFSEYGNNTVRRIDAATGIITTIAGNGSQGYSGDGNLAINAQLGEPNCVFIDKHHYMYISDYGNNVIRLVTPAGIIYTIAGSGGYGYTGDGGPPLEATFKGPTAVCTDDSGNVYIADGFNSVIRKMTPIDTLTLGVREIVTPAFHIYPDPSDGHFSIIPGQQTNADVQVVNMMGQCLYSARCTGKRMDINLSACPAGMYFVRYNSPAGTVTKKIIIQ